MKERRVSGRHFARPRVSCLGGVEFLGVSPGIGDGSFVGGQATTL